ncbi:MAG: topoisomerase II [Actinomycetales bacterium]|nr:topoisomerase II [Actinomycetales bacterium]
MPSPAPFVRRPFEGLPGETDWVAMREFLPAATAAVRFATKVSAADVSALPQEAVVATVLPMAWPGLHREGGGVMVATQSGATSGDASRDVAAAWLLAAAAEEGHPVVAVPTPTADSPRLQDILDVSAPLEVTVHEGFEFWVGDTELDEDSTASLQRANESVVPTRRVVAAGGGADGGAAADVSRSVFWVRFGPRTFVRWVLPDDEDAATDGLARLVAADRQRLTPESRLLGAFRASGLLVPVWEVDAETEVESLGAAVAALVNPMREAIESSVALTSDERRARNGLLSRQVTLR